MNLAPLPVTFYAREPVAVARDLLGKLLVRATRQGIASGVIVEVEAYLAEVDSACHAYRGRTPRNAVMFGPPGRLYVYSIHSRYCLNAVTETRGVGSAVLIRALEPRAGIAAMQARRNRESLLDLTRGPARLCEAMDVDRRLDGWNLTLGKRIWIAADAAAPHPAFRIARSPRIGVTSAHDAALRFFIDGSRFVSGPRRFHSMK
jgi:DNA-3-methyladenine glycosylase